MMTDTEEIMKEANEMFNSQLYYKSTKLNYLEDLRHFLDEREEKEKLWTRATIKQKINEIKETKNSRRKTVTEFDVALLNGEEILILTDTTVQVLPYEDYFDAFIDLHKQFGHLKQSEMIKKLSTQYVIEEKFLAIFINSCNACSRIESHRKFFNQMVHIDILGMVHKPDNDFNFILLYIEMASDFIIIRPLLTTVAHEVASELYKIFIDFGPPLAITTSNSQLLNDVMQTLKMTPVKYDIPIYNQKEFHKISGACLIELEKWLTYSSSNNWAFGCYIVQYILNTKSSAKNKVFGKKSEKSLNVPYEQQSSINVDDHINVMSMKNEDSQSTEQNVTEKASYLKNILNNSELHTEEDLGIDYEYVKTENDKEDDIEDKLDYTVIPNRADNITPCSVCSRKGLSELVKCSICQKYVHVICAERFPFEQNGITNSKVVCTKCQ